MQFLFFNKFQNFETGVCQPHCSLPKIVSFQVSNQKLFLKKKMQDGGYKIKNQNLRLPLNQKLPEKRISV